MNFLSKYLQDVPSVPENLTGILLGTVALLASWSLWMSYGRPNGTPPGPNYRWPLFGHIFRVGLDPRKSFKEWRKKYGDIFSVYFGSRMVIVINGFEVLKDTFVKNGELFTDRPHGMFVVDKIGKGMGVISSNGNTWKEQRRFTLSTLRDFGMGRNMLEKKICEEADIYLKLVAERNGEKLNLNQFTQNAVANIICSIVFGKRFEYDDKLFKNYMFRVDQNVKAIGTTAAMNFISFTKYVPGDPFKMKRTLQNVAFVEETFIQKSIDEHIKAYDENNISDFISAYLKEIKLRDGKDTSIGLPNMTKVIGDLFVAGDGSTEGGKHCSIISVA